MKNSDKFPSIEAGFCDSMGCGWTGADCSCDFKYTMKIKYQDIFDKPRDDESRDCEVCEAAWFNCRQFILVDNDIQFNAIRINSNGDTWLTCFTRRDLKNDPYLNKLKEVHGEDNVCIVNDRIWNLKF